MTPEAEAKLRAVYERLKPVDRLLGNPDWCGDSTGHEIAGELYRAIRDALGE